MSVPINPSLRGRARSATLGINRRSRAMQTAGQTVYRFGLGQSPFPVPKPVVQALRNHAAEKDYLPVEGLGTLRAAVAGFHRRVDGVEFEPEGVLIGPGSKELLFLAQFAFDGELLAPTPCWVSYGPQARMAGLRIKRIPTRFEDRFRLRPAQLATACAEDPSQRRLLILNTPGNPDGDSYSPSELAALAEVARAHRVIVLSDEIYGPTHHRDGHCSIARFYPEGTMISGGLSKWCGAGGWRLGTIAFPKPLYGLRDAMATAASETFTSVSAPIQYAAVSAFEGGPELDAYLGRCRGVLRILGRLITARLRSAGVRLHDPTGGFYLWLDFSGHADALARRGIETGSALCERLLTEAGVAILPASAFERSDDELAARLAYVDFDGGAVLEASRAASSQAPPPEAVVETHCRKTLDGVDALVRWLEAGA